MPFAGTEEEPADGRNSIARRGSTKRRMSLRDLRLSRRAKETLESAEDDSAENEIAGNLWRHHRLMLPNSDFKERWDIAILVLVLYILHVRGFPRRR